MPAAWMTGTREVKASREKFTAACDLFEMWRMPRGTFNRSRAETVVLLARKRKPSEQARPVPTVVDRVTRPDAVDAFYAGRVVASSRTLLENPFSRRADVDARLRAGVETAELDGLAVVRTGAELNEQGRQQEAEGSLQGPYSWLRQLRGTALLESLDGHHQPQVPIPGPFKVNIPEWQAKSPKVLVGTQATPESPYLRVLLDASGGLVGGKGTLWAVPRREYTAGNMSPERLALGLLALLVSRAVAAWMDEVRTSRNNRTTDLRRLPVPADRQPGRSWRRRVGGSWRGTRRAGRRR